MVNGAWNIRLLYQVLPADIVHKVLAIPVPCKSSPDVMVWTASTSGKFSLSSAYHELREVKHSSFMLKQFWHSQVPLKVSFFMLQLWKGWLPMDDVLSKFQLHLPLKCFCCSKSQSEFISHVLMEGDLVMAVWEFFWVCMWNSVRKLA